MLVRWRDIVREAAFQGRHTSLLQLGILMMEEVESGSGKAAIRAPRFFSYEQSSRYFRSTSHTQARLRDTEAKSYE
jgi:hypothetical protein